MKDLISALKKKDEEALKKVMLLYKNDVFRYLLFLTANPEVAEELTQDTFVKVYFKAHTLKGESLKSWIMKIALNNARSHFRREKIKRLITLQPLHQINEQEFAVNSQAEDLLLIEKVKKTIPEKYLTPFLLKELHNFSYEEIASLIGKPVGTVKSLIFRARDQLREKFSLISGG